MRARVATMANDFIVGNDDTVDDAQLEEQQRVKAATSALKSVADRYLLQERYEESIKAYRDLLMQLTFTQVKVLLHKDLVMSCRLNIMAALSKSEQWAHVVREARNVFEFMKELKNQPSIESDARQDAQIIGRALYFQGFAKFQMGSLKEAVADFQRAMSLLPNDDVIREDYMLVDAALQKDKRVRELFGQSTSHFRSQNYPAAVSTCEEAITLAKEIKRTDIVGIMYGNLAAVHTKLQDHKKIIECYQHAIAYNEMQTTRKPELEEKLFEYYDALASQFSRLKKYEEAYKAMTKSIQVLEKCPNKSTREPLVKANAGRLCFTLDNVADALKYFKQAEQLAFDAKQYEHAAEMLIWQSRAYEKLNKTDSRRQAVGKVFDLVKRHGMENTYVYNKAMVEQMMVLEDKNKIEGRDLNDANELLEYFRRQKNTLAHLRLAFALLTKNSEVDESQVFAGYNDVNLSQLDATEADVYVRILLFKVDKLVASSKMESATEALDNALKRLSRSDSFDACRCLLLRRFVELTCGNEKSEPPNVLENVQQLICLLKKEERTEAVITELSRLLTLLSQRKMRNGFVSESVDLMEENVLLLKTRPASGTAQQSPSYVRDEQLCEALVGLCVLAIKKGDTARAIELVREIDSLNTTKMWHELDQVRDQLHRAIQAESRRPVQPSISSAQVPRESKKAWDEQLVGYIGTGISLSILVLVIAMWVMHMVGLEL